MMSSGIVVLAQAGTHKPGADRHGHGVWIPACAGMTKSEVARILLRLGSKGMKHRPAFMENPDKYEIANEVLSSAIRVLQAAGFYEDEIIQLFSQAARKRRRFPLYLEPLPNGS